MIEKKIPYILLLCYLIYFAQQYLPSFKLLSSVCALIATAICCYYFFKTLLLKERHGLIIIALLFLSISFLFSFVLAQDKSKAISYLKELVLANFMFSPVYYLSKKKILNEEFFKWIFIPLLIFYIYNYIWNYQKVVFESLSGSENVANNVGYNILTLLPLILFFKKDYLKLIFIGIISIFVIYSAKIYSTYYMRMACDKNRGFLFWPSEVI